MIIVTSYRNPDIDGIACSIGYSELLNKLGKKSRATYYGNIGLEVKFVKDYCEEFPIEKVMGGYKEDDEFILLDTADPDATDPEIKPEKVIEIFDHRELVFTDKFPKAKSKIELVGSCATLVTEEFNKKDIDPSKTSTIFLYSAIISNTINFKNTVTTERDKNAANYLQSLVKLPDDYIKRMFLSKSNVDASNLQSVIEQDFSTKEIGGKRFGLAQIEVANLEKLLTIVKPQLKHMLGKIRDDKKLDYVLFTGIDILEGFNIFIVLDKRTGDLFSKVLGISNFDDQAKINGIIMRKQMWPKINKIVESMK